MFYCISYDISGRILQKFCITTESLPDNTDNLFYLRLDNIEFDLTAFRVDISTKELIELPYFDKEYQYYDYQANSIKIDSGKLDIILRNNRENSLLTSDWTELPSALTRLGEAKVNEWQAYRQALRDIPTQPGYPENVTWPQQPK